MRAAYVTGYQPTGIRRHGELAAPVRRPDDVLVRVKAAGVNPVDGKIWSGLFKRALKLQFPLVLGLEIAGVVEDAPPGSRFSQGMRSLPPRPRAQVPSRNLLPSASARSLLSLRD